MPRFAAIAEQEYMPLRLLGSPVFETNVPNTAIVRYFVLMLYRYTRAALNEWTKIDEKGAIFALTDSDAYFTSQFP